MSYVVVQPWQRPPKKEPPRLGQSEVDRMTKEIQETLTLIADGLAAGRNLDDKLIVLHGTAVGLRDGDRVSVSITRSKK